VESVPAGAAIAVNGQKTDSITPASLTLKGAQGTSQKVAVSLDGYQPESQSVTLGPGIQPLSFSLKKTEKPVAKGSLSLSLPWAAGSEEIKVSVDGQSKGRYSPGMKVEGLSPGSHTVSIRSLKPFVKIEASVEISPGQEARLQKDVSFGRFFAYADPTIWCKVLIDGEYVDDTPLTNHRIAAGRYRIEFRSDGAQKKWVESSFEIKADRDNILKTSQLTESPL
jgi:hypothetical protein